MNVDLTVHEFTVINATVYSLQSQITTGRNFHERLAACVDRDGRPKRDIARAAGVHPSALSRWLSGSTPDAENLSRLARALRVDESALLFGARPAPVVTAHVREPAQPYHVTPAPLPLHDVLTQLHADLDAIGNAPPHEARRLFLFLREAHLPLLARALQIEA